MRKKKNETTCMATSRCSSRVSGLNSSASTASEEVVASGAKVVGCTTGAVGMAGWGFTIVLEATVDSMATVLSVLVSRTYSYRGFPE